MKSQRNEPHIRVLMGILEEKIDYSLQHILPFPAFCLHLLDLAHHAMNILIFSMVPIDAKSGLRYNSLVYDAHRRSKDTHYVMEPNHVTLQALQ